MPTTRCLAPSLRYLYHIFPSSLSSIYTLYRRRRRGSAIIHERIRVAAGLCNITFGRSKCAQSNACAAHASAQVHANAHDAEILK